METYITMNSVLLGALITQRIQRRDRSMPQQGTGFATTRTLCYFRR